MSDINEMLEFFNNSTEQGKLYINYPSIESFSDINNDDFNNYYFQVNNGQAYKDFAAANERLDNSYKVNSSLTKDSLLHLCKLHLIKANYICNSINDLPNNIDDIEQTKLFDKQLEFYNTTQKVYIISSMPLFLFEFDSKDSSFKQLLLEQ